MVIAFIGLGSNLGDRKGQILRAIDLLRHHSAIQVKDVSTLLETQPVGPVHDQPAFINGVAAVETTLTPHELLDELLAIERSLGRVRTERWGPRTIDLDILLYGNERIDLPDLQIPHPEIKNRPFVQAGLQELAVYA